MIVFFYFFYFFYKSYDYVYVYVYIQVSFTVVVVPLLSIVDVSMLLHAASIKKEFEKKKYRLGTDIEVKLSVLTIFKRYSALVRNMTKESI